MSSGEVSKMVKVDFRCTQCRQVSTMVVAHNVWRERCPLCGGEAKRLIQVQFQFPVKLNDENVYTFRAMNEKIEPDERVIRAIHQYNYGEEPDKKTIKEVKEKRLVVW